MEKKYISENRYKKSTGKKRRDISAFRKSSVSHKQVKKSKIKKKNKPRIKPSIRRERRINRRNIFACIILLILVAIILRALLKEEGEPFIPIFFGAEENEQVISIGVITDEDLLDDNINNVILKELNYYSNYHLLKINDDYSLEYDVIRSIEKNTNSEYVINLNKSKEYNASSVKKVLEGYINNRDSIYRLQLIDVNNIKILSEDKLKITLKKDNPYFVYNLDVPICSASKKQYEIKSNSTNTYIEYERTKYANEEIPARIIVKRFKDMYEGVEAYKKGSINMLVTNQKNVQNMLGKYEYNLKTYRNGETIFLLLNQNSEWLNKKEIRKVIAYSIDRESIVKNIMQSTANIIDLPYIYDVVKYKYDIYAAENLLLANGYSKQNKIYTKKGKPVTLKLIVNKDDEEKVQIATAIKNNLASIGIKINIEKLSKADIEKRINKGNYDLVISSINLNNKPDISFLKNNMYITDEIQDSISQIEEISITDLSKQINKLSKELSQNISCIGIAAKTNYVIYSKEISGIGKSSYLNVLSNLVTK